VIIIRVIEIRVTVDIDQKNPLKMAYCVAKGTFLCKKLPYLIRKSKRGWHIGWHHLPITERESYLLRYRLSDDLKRLHLDMSCPKKPKQVLFSEKIVYVHEFDAFGNYIGKKRVQ
jgi:hypothetical protein